MGKQILIVSSSLRENSNSDALAAAFAKGAAEAGYAVETVHLRGRQLAFCTGCQCCASLGQCVIADDAADIVRKIHDADAVVFATPIYYYSVCGQLKVLLDRANPLYGSDYAFRKVFLLAVAADDAESAVSGAVKVLQGWADCFERATLAGVVFAGGVNDAGEIAGHPALAQAYETGKRALA